MSEIIMSTDSKSDALWHLADALSEDILNTGADELFAEVAEDHQSHRTLTTEFDRISWRSLRRVRRQQYVERLRRLIERPWPSARLATVSIATLAVIAFASALYLDAPFTPSEQHETNLAGPDARSSQSIVTAEEPKGTLQGLNSLKQSAPSLPDFAPAPNAMTEVGRKRETPIGANHELELAASAQAELGAKLPPPLKPVVGVANNVSVSSRGPNVGPRVPEGGERAKALTPLQYAADQGQLAAQWKVGRMYADGDGVPQDNMRAFNYFSQIANTHTDESPGTPQARLVANAFVALGRYYLSGIPGSTIKPDAARAREMFSYAASYFGDADAQYQLGRLYLDGSPSDPHQAALWFQLAATKGDCPAEAVLGDMLFQGRSVPRQAARGLMWLTLSKDCAGPEETWVKPLFDYAFRRASEDERAMALVYLEDWFRYWLSRREMPPGSPMPPDLGVAIDLRGTQAPK
jgi:TPR repeat protein